MILAQYTIRSKQDYIFKTNRVLEIIGASENIAKVWDVLFEEADKCSIKYKRVNDKDFNVNNIKQEFQNKTLNLVELFCGGGNETLLFDSDIIEGDNGNTVDENSSFIKLNQAFSYRLITEFSGMIPMVSYVKYTGNYSEDYKLLMNETDRKKNIMEPTWDMFTVPFAMMDRSTFQPYSKVKIINGNKVRMSDESANKYAIGQTLRNNNADIRLFDEMVTRKGKESLLAVVHADGNNMGAKIMGMLKEEADYDKAVTLMREFTIATEKCFEDNGGKALEKCQRDLEASYKKLINEGKLKKSSLAFRRVIGSGDDVTFICNARFVMDYVKAYLDSVQNYKSKWSYSSCAGVCIFHSHYPLSRAYAIAEQACDDFAKSKVHIVGNDGKPVEVEQGWVDFHFIHSGIGGDLEEIRRSQGTDRCIARPWLVTFDKEDAKANSATYKYSDLLKLKAVIEKKRNEKGKEDSVNGTRVSRTSLKTVGSAYERSESAARKELISLYGHNPGLKEDVEKIYKDEGIFLKALYDFAEVYDLWYTEVK